MKSQITCKSLLANFNYHQIKCIAKLSIFGTLHLMFSRDMSTAVRGSMIGALLQNEPQGKTEGAQALAAWSSHIWTLNKLIWAGKWPKRAGKERSSNWFYPFSFLSFRKAGISKGKIRKYSSSNNIKNYPKELPCLSLLFYE